MDPQPTAFAFTRLPGPCMCPYNVLNDRTLALSAGCVQNKHQLAGAYRHWPLASIRSAQRAVGAPYTVRGGQHLRPSALPQRCFRCITRLSHGQVRYRASSDTVPSLAVNGSMSVCHHSPTADKASAAPARRCMVHAWLGEYDTLRPCAVSADDV